MAEIVPGMAATYTFGTSQQEYYAQVMIKLGWLALLPAAARRLVAACRCLPLSST